VLWEHRMDATAEQCESETQSDGCNGHCGKCPTKRDDQLVPDSVPEGGIEGASLVSFAALAFLLPPVLAIVAAVVFGGSTNRTVIAAMGGLVVGVAVAKLGSLALTKKEHTESSI
jgi:positive regulator of sigma E activity